MLPTGRWDTETSGTREFSFVRSSLVGSLGASSVCAKWRKSINQLLSAHKHFISPCNPVFNQFLVQHHLKQHKILFRHKVFLWCNTSDLVIGNGVLLMVWQMLTMHSCLFSKKNKHSVMKYRTFSKNNIVCWLFCYWWYRKIGHRTNVKLTGQFSNKNNRSRLSIP